MTLSLYLDYLNSNQQVIQGTLNNLIQKNKIQPVGNGYIDLILSVETAKKFMADLTQLQVAVYNISWWCHTTEESKASLGCPHGYGGPRNKSGDGWFSECVQYPDFDIFMIFPQTMECTLSAGKFSEECNSIAENYLINILPVESFYMPCIHPGLWLYVPDAWTRNFSL